MKKTTTTAKTQGITGIKEVISQNDPAWNLILKTLNRIAQVYGFLRMETPILEESQLYHNLTKDHIEKDLHRIELEVSGQSYSVRPTLLPSVLRAFAQKKHEENEIISKWLYLGNVIKSKTNDGFISDYEFGLEVLGNFSHLTEAQTIAAAWHFVTDLGLPEITLEVNTIGDSSCQQAYESALKNFLKDNDYDLCDNCSAHIKSRTLNVLRCNNAGCQEMLATAPTILDFLDEATHKHFTSILEALDELQIPYQLNPLLVGKEGYSKTSVIMKYVSDKETVVLAEGGYHDSLLKNVGGKGLSSFGFTGGFMNLKHAMDLAKIELEQDVHSEVYLVPLGELAAKKSLKLFRDLIAEEVMVYDHFGTAGVKNQLKQAEASKSPIALIMGQKEAMDEMVILRDVKSGMQELFSYDKIVVEVKKRLGR